MNFGSYAIVAADSRETFFLDSSSEATVDEAMEKVRQTPFGLATGSGLTKAVFGAIEDLATNYNEVLCDPAETGEYLRAFMREFAKAAGQNTDLHPTVRGHLDRAGWVFTSRQHGRLRVRRHHPSRDNYAPEYFNHGVPAVLLPIDLTAENSGPHEYELMRAIVPCLTMREVETTLPRNLSAIARFFQAIDDLSEHLGPGIQIGVHFEDGEVEVLPIQPLTSLG